MQKQRTNGDTIMKLVYHDPMTYWQHEANARKLFINSKGKDYNAFKNKQEKLGGIFGFLCPARAQIHKYTMEF